MRFTRIPVPEPAPERRPDMIVLDGTPQAPGAHHIPALGRDGREDADAEDAAAVVAYLLGHRQRLDSRARGVVDLPGFEREGGQLDEHALLPPHHPDLLGERRASRNQLVRRLWTPCVS